MKRFTIKELETYTGIKEHTFRIWERRYGLVIPRRTKGNLRSYCLQEVQLLLTVALLYAQGIRISTLMRLTPSEIELQAAALMTSEAVQLRTIFKLIVHMYACNLDEFETTLDGYTAAAGYQNLIEKIVVPFIEKIGLFSYDNKSSERHLVVTILRKKIILAIESCGTPKAATRSVLLFLPLREHFDLLLLYMTFVLRNSGWSVLYLGTDISIDNLRSVMSARVPDYLLTYQCRKQHFETESFSFYLKGWVDSSRFLIAGCDRADQSPLHDERYFYFTDLLEQLP